MTDIYTYTNGTPGLKSFIMPTGFKPTVEVHMWGGGGAGSIPSGANGVGGGGGGKWIFPMTVSVL